MSTTATNWGVSEEFRFSPVWVGSNVMADGTKLKRVSILGQDIIIVELSVVTSPDNFRRCQIRYNRDNPIPQPCFSVDTLDSIPNKTRIW